MASTAGRTMCKYLSPVLSACHAFIMSITAPIRYGGVVKRSVSTVPFPRPFITLRVVRQYRYLTDDNMRIEMGTNDGKKVVIDPADVEP